jgi:hypothetical protein
MLVNVQVRLHVLERPHDIIIALSRLAAEEQRRTVRSVDLAQKLQIKPGVSVALICLPPDVEIHLPDAAKSVGPTAAEAVVAFVQSIDDLESSAAAAVEAARADRLAWIAYPKAGQLGTELNRDRLAEAAAKRGIQPVRQVSIDDVWSALRFRPL